MTTTGGGRVAAGVAARGRLAAVKATGFVGSAPEETFDRLTRLARALLGTSFATLTVVDDRHSWFKSCSGADVRSLPVEESFCQYVIASGLPFIVTDARADARTAGGAATGTMGIVAWAGFPVRGRGREVVGAFSVAQTSAREWTAGDLEVLDALAATVSDTVALRAGLTEEQLQRAHVEAVAEELRELNQTLLDTTARLGRVARTLQESLLPPLLPTVPGLQVAARYQPAASGEEVMGDFYDVFQAARGTWSITLGDVCGKGPQAARTAALVRHTVRALALNSTVPAKVLYGLNDVLRRYDPDEERFVTVAYASLRPRADRVAVSLGLAGHHPPLLRRASREVHSVGEPGLPAGMFDDPQVRTARVALQPGDVLVLFTDGVVEARCGGEQFGLARLRAVIADLPDADAPTLAGAVEQAVSSFRVGAPQDDTAVLVVAVP